ncbi:DoxX family protein [Roseomonas sp. NAR14]|uniref:DoxX family protein n=1 Tax=Roseomonas acroporae TaxID=2937791 RepID=A0A9X1Y9M1_9PROT|nr:DoxX family protein [Roseomonas acroporae]MCK8786078.1 DoxX family protein [Roseomonas acroporae]
MVPVTPLAWLLAAVLLLAGALNLRGPAFVREEFARLGFPAWARHAVGGLEWLAAILLLLPSWRGAGAVLAALVLLGVVASLARDAAWMRLEYPVVLLVLAALVGWATPWPAP